MIASPETGRFAAPERRPTALGLSPELEHRGFDVAGALLVETYDAMVPDAWRSVRLLPGARRVWLLGCGGRAFGDALRRSTRHLAQADPVQSYSESAVAEEVARQSRAGRGARAAFAWEQRGGRFADFLALGRRAGLGVSSRLGLLLHPVYGPWWALRAIVLTETEGPLTGALDGFDPCGDCPAPCSAACPARAPGPAGFDVGACARHRAGTGGCAERCDARRACPVGADHAYARDLERRHQAASAAWLAANPTPED